MKITLNLTEYELAVLQYLISTADSPYAADPLKDIYEMGIQDEAFDPYASLRSLAVKIARLEDK